MIRGLTEYYISFFHWLAKRARRFVALACHVGSSRRANLSSTNSESRSTDDYTRVRDGDG